MIPWMVAASGAVAGTWAIYCLGAQAYHGGLERGVIYRGPVSSRAVALTFDDGPVPGSTDRIAAILEQAGARGTFFFLAQQVEQHPDLARRIATAGHEVAVHGLTHRHLWLQGPRETQRQLQEAKAIIEAVTGRAPRFYRPPWGHFNLAVVPVARLLGLRVVVWSAAPPDYRPHLVAQELQRHMERALRPGAIVDLHDGGPPGRSRALVEALPAVLEKSAELGLPCVSLREMLDGAR
ncbi:MAG: polysaccharide deacetylase family protein [Limnochordaceae bacterium]|nr:polysaccharide deacetylase family protein [Limnochordaceae bacterium]